MSTTHYENCPMQFYDNIIFTLCYYQIQYE